MTKRYEKLIAVDNLSLDIGQSEVFGLLGPNGAGKTTVIHMLATLLKPTSGSATVNGFDILRDPEKVRSSIGIVFQAPSSDDLLTGYENLKIHALLYGVDPGIREKRISDALELVGLTERKNDQVKKYSGGMRRRLEIARGLIHNPRVLFLDEPTLGLDPSSRETMWEYIQNLVKQEKLAVKNKIPFSSRVLTGDPGHAIIEYVNTHGTDLIVIGARGRSVFKVIFLGSVSSYVLHKSKIPVMVVR